MTVFDDYKGFELNRRGRHRLNTRHHFCVEQSIPFFKDKRVLDLASHDGRWAYAFAEAGASEVVGVEGRQELVEAFEDFPDTPAKSKVKLFISDAVDFMTWLLSIEERFEFVAILGFYYHTMEHFRILQLAQQLGAETIVIDSEFIVTDNPIIQLSQEATDKVSNAIAAVDGQETNVIGIPSIGATERIADVLGYDVVWTDWEELPKDRRKGLGDYFRDHRKLRKTCRLELRRK